MCRRSLPEANHKAAAYQSSYPFLDGSCQVRPVREENVCAGDCESWLALMLRFAIDL